MKRPILIAALSAVLTVPLTAPLTGPAQAAIPVIDASNLAQAVAQVQALAEQLTTLQEQLNTLREQYNTITNMYNEMRGITGHALMLPDPVETLHNFLPAANLDPTELLSGPLASLANSLREANELYSTTELFTGTHLTGAARQYQERSDFIFTYMALAKEAYENVAARRSTLESFATAAGTATTQKAILDLNARISAENALLLNDIAQLQALQLMADLQQQNLIHNSQGMHANRPTGVADLNFGE